VYDQSWNCVQAQPGLFIRGGEKRGGLLRSTAGFSVDWFASEREVTEARRFDERRQWRGTEAVMGGEGVRVAGHSLIVAMRVKDS
jgi:hypothetical protein